ncbi:MAG: Methyltransferase type 11 [Enterovirga sp.]|nr:Methyltransferase type 11 [Enterovirga sp.]
MADDRIAATAADPAVVDLLAGDTPPNIALMRLLMEAVSPDAVRDALREAASVGGPAVRARAGALGAMLDAHPAAWATIRTVMREADHEAAPEEGADPVAHWASVFDRLARLAPEAAVALYALGSPELLAAATDEVVGRMREWRLLGPACHLLEIGCGIGRLSLALAPEVASVVGLDVSAEMIVEARRRAGTRPDIRFERSSGRDLAAIPTASVDLVLAADVFPYLVAAGQDLAPRHVEEAARVLRPGGALLVFNYSYRGDLDADRRDVRAMFSGSGFVAERVGTRDLALWDAATFLGRR